MKPKMRDYIFLSVACLALIFCAVLPRLLFSWQWGEKPTTPEQRMTLWREYWAERNAEDEYSGVAVELTGQTEVCRELAEKISGAYMVDKNGTLPPAGMEEISYTGSEGTLHLFHFYRQWQGDWANWVDMFIDVDSQEIYYFYISSGCKQNLEQYADMPFSEMLTDEMARLWGDYIQCTMTDFVWSGEAGDAATAVYSGGNETARTYSVIYTCYSAALFYLKILMQ